MLKRNVFRLVAAVVILAWGTGATAQQAASVVEVYKSATCGCCSKWVDHLRANKFTVRTTDTEDMDAVKARYKVPAVLQSCHTAIVGGYVIEGHVPAADVQRLLKERPDVVGLAVPGMPAGSPGMEVPGQKPDAYNVVAFDKAGRTTIFASHNK